MGAKPSNIFQMDRPESGGSDRDRERENNGLLDRARQDYAEHEKGARSKPAGGAKPGPKVKGTGRKR